MLSLPVVMVTSLLITTACFHWDLSGLWNWLILGICSTTNPHCSATLCLLACWHTGWSKLHVSKTALKRCSSIYCVLFFLTNQRQKFERNCCWLWGRRRLEKKILGSHCKRKGKHYWRVNRGRLYGGEERAGQMGGKRGCWWHSTGYLCSCCQSS